MEMIELDGIAKILESLFYLDSLIYGFFAVRQYYNNSSLRRAE